MKRSFHPKMGIIIIIIIIIQETHYLIVLFQSLMTFYTKEEYSHCSLTIPKKYSPWQHFHWPII